MLPVTPAVFYTYHCSNLYKLVFVYPIKCGVPESNRRPLLIIALRLSAALPPQNSNLSIANL